MEIIITKKTTTIPLTDNEKYIIETLRALKPFETITITADKQGKINNFLLGFSSKIILTDNGPLRVI